jgi:hypothetical protein
LSATIRFSRAFSLSSSFEPLGVVGLHAAVLGAPAMIGRLADLQVLADLGDLLAFGQQPVGLTELADDLLGGVPASFHGVLLPSFGLSGLSYQADQSQEVTSAGCQPCRR